MRPLDLIKLMPSNQFVVVIDSNTGEVLIDDTVDRVLAFEFVDENIHKLLRNSKVCEIKTSFHSDLALMVNTNS